MRNVNKDLFRQSSTNARPICFGVCRSLFREGLNYALRDLFTRNDFENQNINTNLTDLSFAMDLIEFIKDIKEIALTAKEFDALGHIIRKSLE